MRICCDAADDNIELGKLYGGDNSGDGEDDGDGDGSDNYDNGNIYDGG